MKTKRKIRTDILISLEGGKIPMAGTHVYRMESRKTEACFDVILGCCQKNIQINLELHSTGQGCSPKKSGGRLKQDLDKDFLTI